MCSLIARLAPAPFSLTPGVRRQPCFMPKPKDPRVTAEDKLFTRGSKESRALLAKSRELKRDADRKAWMKENQP